MASIIRTSRAAWLYLCGVHDNLTPRECPKKCKSTRVSSIRKVPLQPCHLLIFHFFPSLHPAPSLLKSNTVKLRKLVIESKHSSQTWFPLSRRELAFNGDSIYAFEYSKVQRYHVCLSNRSQQNRLLLKWIASTDILSTVMTFVVSSMLMFPVQRLSGSRRLESESLPFDEEVLELSDAALQVRCLYAGRE